MNQDEFRSLFTPQGQEALAAAAALAPREPEFLTHYTQLSRRFPAGMARAALETAILRREAADKFPFAEQMYFTRAALEQATHHAVAAYRAGRYAAFERIFDLGCSTGADTIALCQAEMGMEGEAEAPQGRLVTGVDLDPLRLDMAHANLGALGLLDQAAFVQADLNRSLPFRANPGTALFFDPARRAGGRRIFSVADYHPPLEVVNAWLARFPALGVKISPGVKLDELSGYQAEIEFISLKGELKEAALWFGPLREVALPASRVSTARLAQRRATVLPGPHSMASYAQEDTRLPLSEPLAYLYEPDPSILRAGLVAALGAELGAAQLDPEIAYLTSPHQAPTPFARSWQVVDWFPFGLKRLRAYLRAHHVGTLTVKKRGSPLEPEALIRDLRLKGDEKRVVFLTQLKGKPVVVVCMP